jgi:type IV secretion system protein VirB5
LAAYAAFFASFADCFPHAPIPFRQGTGRIGVAKEDSANPYLNARREWDERYGDALTRAKNWRLFAFGAIGVAAVACLGIAYIGAQSKIKPYVVAIDRMGNPIAMAQPVAGGAVNQRIIEAQVANWVWEWRTMMPDTNSEKALVARVYAMINNTTAATLDPWYKKRWVLASGGLAINASITSVLPLTKDTYQVNWQETQYQNGQSQGTSFWKANITVGIDPKLADSPQATINNPLGIFIKNITWTQVLAASTMGGEP